MQPIVSLNDIHKSFGSHHVLKGVSFNVYPGELVTLLGVNGAGKTTTINLILGLEQASSGEINVLGHRPGSLAARQEVGVTPQSTDFPEGIKVKEILEFARAHYHNPLNLEQICQDFALTDVLERKANDLSGGLKRRIAVALAFIGQPKMVFLDEPTTGLDVNSRQQIWQAVTRFISQGGTVFLTTHYLEEAENLSTRIIILKEGEIKLQGTVNEIKSIADASVVSFDTGHFPDEFPHALKITKHGQRISIETKDVDNLVRELVRYDIEFKHLSIQGSTLEKAFVAMTTGEA